MGSVTGDGVLAARGTVVVRSVAGSVVVVVATPEERVVHRTVGETAADAHTTAAVAISDEGVSLLRTATERHGDGVALGVATAHRLTPPVLSHTVLLLESGGEKLFSAKWGVSSPIDSGETPTSAVAKADKCIHNRAHCQAILRKLQQNMAIVYITASNSVYLTI